MHHQYQLRDILENLPRPHTSLSTKYEYQTNMLSEYTPQPGVSGTGCRRIGRGRIPGTDALIYSGSVCRVGSASSRNRSPAAKPVAAATREKPAPHAATARPCDRHARPRAESSPTGQLVPRPLSRPHRTRSTFGPDAAGTS